MSRGAYDLIAVILIVLVLLSAGKPSHRHGVSTVSDWADAPPSLPSWEATWDIQQSTIVMTCSFKGNAVPWL